MNSPGDQGDAAGADEDLPGTETQVPRLRRNAEAEGSPDLIGGKYEILEAIGQSEAGLSYRARSAGDRREVLLLLLQPTLLVNRAAYTKLVREVEASAEQRHPNLLGHGPIEQAGGASVLAFEWVFGFPLTDLLRVRRKLSAPEVIKLLPHLASGLDFATQAKLTRLNLDLQKIIVSFPNASAELSALAGAPLEQWPAFAIKFNPVNLTPGLDIAETWGGGHTLRRGAAGPEENPEDLSLRHLQACAAIVYELCGGAAVLSDLLQGDALHYVPLAALTEASNTILRETLERGHNFSTVQSFTRAFIAAQKTGAAAEPVDAPAAPRDSSETTAPKRSTAPPIPGVPAQGYETARPMRRTSQSAEKPGPSSADSPSLPPDSLDPLFSTRAPSYRSAAGEPPEKGISRGFAAAAALLGVAGLLAAAVAWWPRLHHAADGSSPGSSAAALPAGDSTLEKLMQNGEWEQALDRALNRAKTNPASPVASLELSSVLTLFRTLPPAARIAQLPSLRAKLQEASDLGNAAATTLLGDDLRLRDPAAAFQLYTKARQLGDARALLEIGKMQLEGTGTPLDEEKAMASFQEAADQAVPDGGAYLGYFSLFGPYGLRNIPKGIALLRKAEQQHSAKALELLGNCFYFGRGVEQDYAKAAESYQEAAKAGEGDAYGSLGLLYQAGTGVPHDEAKGTAFFEQGAEAGSPRCMNFYARALEAGRGIQADSHQAELWQKKAALAGDLDAQQWCARHHVAYP